MKVESFQQQARSEDSEGHSEDEFWKLLSRDEPGPLYGADNLGSFFGNHEIPWNMTRLGSSLNVAGSDLAGVTAPYLYFGQWRSMFALHTEDMDLCAINFVHYGASKQWYSIPSVFADRVLKVAAGYLPDEFEKCSQFLRHKTTLIEPSVLLNHMIPVYKVTQHSREFIITWPRAFHFGFNFGVNCAESVNFANSSWVNYGKNAQVCKCSRNNLHINMDCFIENLKQVFVADTVQVKKKKIARPVKKRPVEDDLKQNIDHMVLDDKLHTGSLITGVVNDMLLVSEGSSMEGSMFPSKKRKKVVRRRACEIDKKFHCDCGKSYGSKTALVHHQRLSKHDQKYARRDDVIIEPMSLTNILKTALP